MGFQQGFRINTNTSSLDTYRNYSASQAGMERNIERLSSGLRINSASDDSAGLSISNRMDNQVRGMQQANRNVQQANNMLQTAEGAMNEIGNILGRMRELAVQSASDGVNADDRESLNLEFSQLKDEITRIASSTEYNGETLLAGDYNTDTSNKTIQVGADNDTTNQLDVEFGNFKIEAANTDFGGTSTTPGTAVSFAADGEVNLAGDDLDLSSLANSQVSIDSLDLMIDATNNARSEIGAKQNRLEFTSANLMNSIQNNAASMSTIRDADFAAEAADLAKNQILVQSGTAMLAQANGLSQNILALIR